MENRKIVLPNSSPTQVSIASEKNRTGVKRKAPETEEQISSKRTRRIIRFDDSPASKSPTNLVSGQPRHQNSRDYRDSRDYRNERDYQNGSDYPGGNDYRDSRSHRSGRDHRDGRDYRNGRDYRDRRDNTHKCDSSYQVSQVNQLDRRILENKGMNKASPTTTISLSELISSHLSKSIQRTVMVMKTVPLNPGQTARTLNSEQLSQGLVNKTLGSPLLRDTIRSIRIFCENNSKPEDFINYNGRCALENIGKLVTEGKFRQITKFDARQAIECILQFRNAHSHNDLVYLLKYNRICLSAVATMAGPTMIDDATIYKDVMEKLIPDGGKCSLPSIIPICQKRESE